MAEKRETENYAAIRIRGHIGTSSIMNDTMKMLHIERKNYCTVIPKTITTEGMLKLLKDYITYGELEEPTFKILVEKRGEPYMGRLTDSKGDIYYKRFHEIEGKRLKPFFRLSPPRGGFERKGIKRSFTRGGALGYRGKDINKLIMRMI